MSCRNTAIKSMGLFDKLNDQLEINNIKNQEYKKEELLVIEQKLLFDRNNNFFLEEDDNWAHYLNYSSKTPHSRVKNPWTRKEPDDEARHRREIEKRDQKHRHDMEDKEAVYRREDEKAEAQRLRDDAKDEKYLQIRQEEYDDQFDYLLNKVYYTFSDYKDDIKDAESMPGTTDEEKQEKAKLVNNITSQYRKKMEALRRQYRDINNEYSRGKLKVKIRRIDEGYFDLDRSLRVRHV